MKRLFPLPLATTLLVLSACAPPPPSAVRMTHTPNARLGVSSTFAVGHDDVSVLPGGEATFQAIAGVIGEARARIEVEMYELGREDLVVDLVNAHHRGVDVSVIDDPSVEMTRASASAMRAAGIDVIDYPIRRLMIDHVKLLIVDSVVAVVGGINWGPASAANHDFDTLVRGPAVHNLDRVYATDLVTSGRVQPVPAPSPDPGMVVATTLPGAEIHPLALNLIETARRSLNLELYVLTDPAIVHALERAHSRGVAITLLLDPGQRPSDPSAAALRAAGVDVRLYQGAGELLHAKAAVADHRHVLFGSANWTVSGFTRNHELDLDIAGSPDVAAAFEHQMAIDWQAGAA